MHRPLGDIQREIRQRLNTVEGRCPTCGATGKIDGEICMDCLGQKAVLLPAEYEDLLEFVKEFRHKRYRARTRKRFWILPGT